MKHETATPVADDTTTTTEPTMPKLQKTATITLTAPGGTMQIVAWCSRRTMRAITSAVESRLMAGVIAAGAQEVAYPQGETHQ